jgi:hypothetical protein
LRRKPGIAVNSDFYMKSRFWKFLALALVVVLLFMAVFYLTAPLPKPHVTLVFQGFKTFGSNTDATICFSNAGKSTVWREPDSWYLEVETTNGWITNHPTHFTSVPWPVPPSSNKTIRVKVPSDAIRWRICAGYEYYDHHNVRLDLADWFIKHNLTKYVFSDTGDRLFRVLAHLPEPKDRYGEACTVMLTNRAPTSINPPSALGK